MLLLFYAIVIFVFCSFPQVDAETYSLKPEYSFMSFKSRLGKPCASFTIGSSVHASFNVSIPYDDLPHQLGFEINGSYVVSVSVNEALEIGMKKVKSNPNFSRVSTRLEATSKSNSTVSFVITVSLSRLNTTDNGLVFSERSIGNYIHFESDPLSVSSCLSTAGVQADCLEGDLCVLGSSAELTCANNKFEKRPLSTFCGECAEFKDTLSCSEVKDNPQFDSPGCDESCLYLVMGVVLWISLTVILSALLYKLQYGFPPWAKRAPVLVAMSIFFPFGLGFLIWWMYTSKNDRETLLKKQRIVKVV